MQEWPSSSDDRSVASTARIVNSTRLYVTFLEDIDGGNGASIIIQKESPTLKALSVCNRNKERVKEIGSIGKKDRCAGNFPMFQCQFVQSVKLPWNCHGTTAPPAFSIFRTHVVPFVVFLDSLPPLPE